MHHLSIGPGLTTTEEPIMCSHEELWKGLEVSQDLDLGILIALRFRSSNVLLNTGRNGNIHCPSAAQQVPSDASIWPIVRRVKGYGHRKENNFQLRCLAEAQIIPKQAQLALIEKQMSYSLSGTHWLHYSKFCRKQAHGYNEAYLRSLMTNTNHASPPLSPAGAFPPPL